MNQLHCHKYHQAIQKRKFSGLPTRDYFLQDSNKVYLEAYKNYLIKIALLLNGDPKHVRLSADLLIEFEIK